MRLNAATDKRYRYLPLLLLMCAGAAHTQDISRHPFAAQTAETPHKQFDESLFGRLMRAISNDMHGPAMRDKARQEWTAVDENVRKCLAQRYEINVDELIAGGIRPVHSSVARPLHECSTTVITHHDPDGVTVYDYR